MRDVVRDYALDTLADPDAVLVIDETGFLKQGKASCGVGRQHAGSAGSPKRGAFAACVSGHGHAFVGRAFHLPKAWTDDPARLAAAHVPADVGFATKPRLARRMIERAMAAGVPFSWVAADRVHGVGELGMALRRAGEGCVLGVNANSRFNSWIGKPEVAGTAEEIAQKLDPAAWQRLSAGEGTKGPRLYGWACLGLADLDADECKSDEVGPWTRGLPIRRSIADGAGAFSTSRCPAGTGIETLVRVEGQRWTIEDSFECAKDEFGLDHNESRSRHGWHRHVGLVMLAFAMLATIRRHANCLVVRPPWQRQR